MKWIRVAIYRFKQQTPAFFKVLVRIGLGISTVAASIQVALNTAEAAAPDWWTTAYPYLIGVGAGMAAAAKLTKE